MTEFEEMAIRHGTDKQSVDGHCYARHYERHFAPFRNREIKLLEIGVGGYEDPAQGGASLRLWKEYFPNAQIVGLDTFDKSALEEDRIDIFRGSQDSKEILDQITKQYGKFDLIIDDGSHVNSHVVFSFNALFPCLKTGGIYVVEDLQTAYWKTFGGSSKDLDAKHTSVGFFRNLVNGLNHREIIRPGYAPNYLDLNIESIHFYHNMVFVYKGDNSEQSNILVNNDVPEHIKYIEREELGRFVPGTAANRARADIAAIRGRVKATAEHDKTDRRATGMISYAQNFEDVMLERVFHEKHIGFYIDVGAADPVNLSITKWFYDRGWSGINIEPVREFHEKLVLARPRDINLNCGAGATRGEACFRVDPVREWSTFDLSSGPSDMQIQEPRQTVVSVRTLDDIIDQYGREREVDFLKIDVEGWEEHVLRGINLQRHRPTIVLLEAIDRDNGHDRSIEHMLHEADYLSVYFDGINKFYLKREHANLQHNFALPPNLFDDFQLYREVEKENVIEMQGAEVTQARIDLLARTQQVDALNELVKNADAERARAEAVWQAETARLHVHLAARMEQIETLTSIVRKAETELARTEAQRSKAEAERTKAEAERDQAEAVRAFIHAHPIRYILQKAYGRIRRIGARWPGKP